MTATKAPAVRRRADARPTRRVLPADRQRAATPLDRLLLDGRRADMQVGDRLLDATIERTMEGPNTVTLTLWDGDRALLTSGVFGRRAMSRVLTITVDGLHFRATGLSKNSDQLILSCEDAVVTTLKRDGRNKPLRMSRGDTTRAHFCARMIRRAGVPVLVLDEDVIQPIAGARQLRRELRKARGDQNGRTSADGGFKSSDLTVKGKPPTREQKRKAAKLIDVAAQENASDRATLALMVAAIGESTLGADRGARGTTLQTTEIAESDLAGQARAFLNGGRSFRAGGAIKLARENANMTVGEIASRTEVSDRGGTFYQAWLEEARTWVKAARGGYLGDTATDSAGHAWVKQYVLERKKDESTWEACSRLLVDEVGWRLFVREGTVVIASDIALARAAAAMRMSERSEAVEGIDFDWHRAARVGEMTATVYLDRWQADPGEVADIEDLPQLERQWLVASVSESLLSETTLATVTLAAPRKPKKEPASDVGQSSPDASDDGDTSLYSACWRIDQQNLPYVWGGGHAHAGTPDGGTGRDIGTGYDCSGSVAAALAAADMGITKGDSVPGSGWFASSWGKPGHGRTHTVWANDSHVFIELNVAGKDGRSFDTRRIGDSRSGPHIRKRLGPTAGFTPRHWSPGDHAAPSRSTGRLPTSVGAHRSGNQSPSS